MNITSITKIENQRKIAILDTSSVPDSCFLPTAGPLSPSINLTGSSMPIQRLQISVQNEKIQNAVKAREELSDILSIGNPSQMRTKLEDWSK